MLAFCVPSWDGEKAEEETGKCSLFLLCISTCLPDGFLKKEWRDEQENKEGRLFLLSSRLRRETD